jgi:PadR family transcriptional regulator AphA
VSTINLTPTSYLVLGCLAVAGPATPYELKQMVAAGIGYFWSFPHSQLYSEPVRLTEAGLVAEARERGGRRRRRFSITEAGRRAVHEWLADPTAEVTDIRDIGLLKLFFGSLADREQIVSLATSQRDAHQERLDVYVGFESQGTDTPAGATLRLGLAYERAAVAFWQSVAEKPPRP